MISDHIRISLSMYAHRQQPRYNNVITYKPPFLSLIVETIQLIAVTPLLSSDCPTLLAACQAIILVSYKYICMLIVDITTFVAPI